MLEWDALHWICTSASLSEASAGLERRLENLPLQPTARLSVMTGFTEWLPVGLVPEQLLIAAVGDDVVDHGGGRQAILAQTFGAERVLL